MPAAVGSRIFTQYPLCAGGQSQHSTVAHQPGPQPLKEAGPTSFYRSVAREWVLVSQWDEIISESLSPGFSNSERTMMPPLRPGLRARSCPKGLFLQSGMGAAPGQTAICYATFNSYLISLSHQPLACSAQQLIFLLVLTLL